jgi:8-oxo-dGTP pyrophosphatase MutT (NUDIX family)
MDSVLNDQMFSLDLGLNNDVFTESKDYYYDGDIYDRNIKKQWFITSDDGAKNCCISVSGYQKPLRGRSILVVLKNDNDKWYALIKRKINGAYEFPGGGWDKGETPEKAAVRECHEEAQAKSKNIKRIGTMIEYKQKESQVSLWVRQHVANKNDWWYGYYSAIFIGMYDGKFNGYISEEDREDTFEWKTLDFIKTKIPKKFQDAIADYINKETGTPVQECTFDDYCGDAFEEAVNAKGKKFDKAYKAAYNYDNGHMIKITYALDGCEITNVGVSKPRRDTLAQIAENVNKENHRGSKETKWIRSFMVVLKAMINLKKNVKKRKKFITDFLNDHIGEVEYLDFQAKDCKILSIYDLYEKREITEEINVVGVFAARRLESSKRNILSDTDLKKVHDLVESQKTKFKVTKYKVGQVDQYPTFMSTYWNDKDDHTIMGLDQKLISSDSEDRALDKELDNIPDIIGDLEMAGYHLDDEYVKKYLSKYRKEETHDLIGDIFSEAVGDADDKKPESDHPIKDTFMDIDQSLLKHQQNAKRAVQNVQNVVKAATKPIVRTHQWISNMIAKVKDIDETNVKERMSDPHGRSAVFNAVKAAIAVGSLTKAGLLLNPIILFLGVTRLKDKGTREHRLRNEMIGELKTELAIIDEKIKDADIKGDHKAKYQLMRFKNELNKKLLRVGGAKGWSKAI